MLPLAIPLPFTVLTHRGAICGSEILYFCPCRLKNKHTLLLPNRLASSINPNNVLSPLLRTMLQFGAEQDAVICRQGCICKLRRLCRGYAAQDRELQPLRPGNMPDISVDWLRAVKYESMIRFPVLGLTR